MFSYLQVAGAALGCGPIAGAWLLRANLRLAGRPAAGRVTVVLAALVTVALLPLSLGLRVWAPSMPVEVLVVVPALVLGACAYRFFPTIDPQLKATFGEVLTPAIVAALVTAAVVVAGYQAMRIANRPLWLVDRWMDRVTVAPGVEVFYQEGATRAEARVAATALHAAGGAPKGVEVKVAGPRGQRKVAFAPPCGETLDAPREASLEALARRIQQAAFAGETVDVQWCTCTGEVKQRLPLLP